jgi:hypothetical protein
VADPIQLDIGQCRHLAGIMLCGDLLEKEKHQDKPRAIYSGLLPTKDGTHAWVFECGLVMTSAEVFVMLGGDPNV